MVGVCSSATSVKQVEENLREGQFQVSSAVCRWAAQEGLCRLASFYETLMMEATPSNCKLYQAACVTHAVFSILLWLLGRTLGVVCVCVLGVIVKNPQRDGSAYWLS